MIRLIIKRHCWIPEAGWVFPNRVVNLDADNPLAEILVAHRLAKLDGRSPEHRHFQTRLRQRKKRNFTDARLA